MLSAHIYKEKIKDVIKTVITEVNNETLYYRKM